MIHVRRALLALATSCSPAVSPLLMVPASADATVDDATISNTLAPTISGTARFGGVLSSSDGTWDQPDVVLGHVWLRDGVAVGTGRTCAIGSTADLGRRLRVRATRPGFEAADAISPRTGSIKYLGPVRRTVTYRVARKAERGSLRDYRRLVLNHETGHWLGRGHATCSGKGDRAAVKQQQGKALGGFRINPWPKSGELHFPRFSF